MDASVDVAHLESWLARSLCSVNSSCDYEEFRRDVGGEWRQRPSLMNVHAAVLEGARMISGSVSPFLIPFSVL